MYLFPIKLCVLLVASMVEIALDLEYVCALLGGLVMTVPKVCSYIAKYNANLLVDQINNHIILLLIQVHTSLQS